MTQHVGIDLVHTDEVQEALDEHGSRYLDRVFTEQEQRDPGLMHNVSPPVSRPRRRR